MSPDAPRPKRRILLRLFQLWLMLTGASALTLGVLWQRGILEPYLENWLQKRVIDREIRLLQPKLPFTIEKYDYDASFRDFKEGRISRISFTLKWGKWRIRLSGPLLLEKSVRKNELFSVHFNPVATLEPAAGGGAGSRSGEVKLELWTQVSRNVTDFDDFGFELQADKFAWPLFGIQSEGLHVQGAWEENHLDVEAGLKSLVWTEGAHNVSVDKPELNVHSALRLAPLSIGPEVAVSFAAGGGELLWDQLYLDLPLKHLPLETKVTLAGGPPGPLDRWLKGAKISIGRSARTGKLDLDVEFHPWTAHAGAASARHADSTAPDAVAPSAHSGLPDARIKWKSTDLPIAPLVAYAGTLPGHEGLADLKFPRGALHSQGEAFWPGKEASGTLDLKDVTLRWERKALAARGLNLHAPFSTRTGAPEIRVGIRELYFKRLRAKLEEFLVSLTRDPAGGVTLSVPQALPLTVEGFPVKLGAVHGKIGGPTGYELTTSASLEKIPVENLLKALCVPVKRVPPVTLSAHFPEIALAKGDIDPTGDVELELFGGKIKVSEVGLFNLDTDVPEVDFDAEWDGIRLLDLTKWLYFGEIKGTLEGYARGVTFQSWLPTRYDFRIEAKPSKGKWVELAPDAMKNFVQVFAGYDALGKLPGVAQWAFFGWPSRFFGGYDAHYLGITAFAQDGSILLETLDPPEIVAKEGKHFILYGSRFNMVLASDHYPLVVDETAMANYVRGMSGQFSALAEKGKNKNGSSDEKHEPLDPTCLPPDLDGP